MGFILSNKANAILSLAAGFVAFTLTVSATCAATYSTSGAPTQYSLGDQLNSQYDILAVDGVSGTLVDGGSIILNNLSFTAGVNATTPHDASGSFTETMTVDAGTPQQLSIPFTLSVNYQDTLTIIGGATLSFLDSAGTLWQVVVNGLVIGPNAGGTEYGQLTANVTDPPAYAPLPGALPLFASGLGAMGLLSLWRRRKSEALTPPVG